MATLADAMPQADDMDPESCYLGFEIAFRSHADKAAIERVFDFVRDVAICTSCRRTASSLITLV
jgi:two-component system chemotaxis sensor kinase CheA